MAQTLPSDLYIPTVAAEVINYKFYENLGMFSRFMGGEGSPINVNLLLGGFDKGGQYVDVPTFKPIASFMSRRDLTSASDATPAKVESRNDNGVRCSSKAICSLTESAIRINGVSAERFTQFIAEEYANRMWLYIRNFILGSLRGAVTSMSGTPHTVSAWSATVRTNLSTSLMAQIKSTFGDRADIFEPGRGAGWIIRSEPYYKDLIQSQLNSGVAGIADNAAGTGNALTLGLPFAIADDAALTTADAGFDKYYTLLLGPNAIKLDIQADVTQPLWLNPKAENVEWVYRADYDFHIQIAGKNYDKTNGGANPTLATISTSTNWDDTYSDHREVLIAQAEHNYSGN